MTQYDRISPCPLRQCGAGVEIHQAQRVVRDQGLDGPQAIGPLPDSRPHHSVQGSPAALSKVGPLWHLPEVEERASSEEVIYPLEHLESASSSDLNGDDGRSVGSFCSNENLSESAGWRESRVWKALAPSWSKLKEREAQAGKDIILPCKL